MLTKFTKSELKNHPLKQVGFLVMEMLKIEATPAAPTQQQTTNRTLTEPQTNYFLIKNHLLKIEW